MPRGAASSKACTARIPSLKVTHRHTSATTIAAIESAYRSAGIRPLNETQMSPTRTTAELQMSVLKCSASASSAWLLCSLAALYSTRDRETSTTIEVTMTMNDQAFTSTSILPGGEAVKRFADDPDAGEQEQAGLEQGREVLYLSVTVEMFGVGRLARDAHREHGHDGGYQVEAGMRRLGEDAEASGPDADDDLEGGEPYRREHRGQRRSVLVGDCRTRRSTHSP